VVRKALADGGYLSGNAPASGLREPEALVGEGNPEDRSGALLAVFCLVTLFAQQPMAQGSGIVRQTAR
jgi:hypothetical protein